MYFKAAVRHTIPEFPSANHPVRFFFQLSLSRLKAFPLQGRLRLKRLMPPKAARRFQKKHHFGGDLQ